MKSLFNTVILFGTFCSCRSSTSSSSLSSTSSEEITSTTLTTAKSFLSSVPKPSSLYRRINVNRQDEQSSTPLDLFRVRADDPGRRSHMDSVWKWDFWCQLQPKVGNCTTKRKSHGGGDLSGPRQSYYYDSQLDACLSFMYSGCDGNRNNFATLVECERHCKGATYMTLKESTRTTFCGLQPNAGLCLALINRYYYDVNGDECKSFIYGGCGGNQNRFKTKMVCDRRCKDDSKYD